MLKESGSKDLQAEKERVRVCICVCVFTCVCVCMYVSIYVCCVCVCVFSKHSPPGERPARVATVYTHQGPRRELFLHKDSGRPTDWATTRAHGARAGL